tara:strand:- start:3 stop:197 length:195 start_codon:yes stop_codon:yes gene_type:complete
MSKILDNIVDWLECEVEHLEKYADKFFNNSNLSLTGSDFINVGKHETAKELLTLIKEEWEVTDG